MGKTLEKNTGKTKYTPLSSLSKECGDRVNTSMGHGTIAEVRKNGQVCVVRLDWELANSGQATMIVETNNLL